MDTASKPINMPATISEIVSTYEQQMQQNHTFTTMTQSEFCDARLMCKVSNQDIRNPLSLTSRDKLTVGVCRRQMLGRRGWFRSWMWFRRYCCAAIRAERHWQRVWC